MQKYSLRSVLFLMSISLAPAPLWAEEALFNPNKPVQFPSDVCVWCPECCADDADLSILEPHLGDDRFGKMSFPQVLRRKDLDLIDSLSRAGEIGAGERHEIVRGLSSQAMMDLCARCGCCADSDAKLEIEIPDGARPLLEDFVVIPRPAEL